MVQNRSKVFVGNLLETVKKDEIKRLFGRFGQLRKVWLAHNPPGFAFIEFFNQMDAKNCVRSLDGKSFSGSKIRVELSYSEGPKPGNPKGKILNQKGRQQNWFYDNNMQMRRNRNYVNGFGNGVFKQQLQRRNFENAFDDIGMNFRGNMNYRKRNNFNDNSQVYRERIDQRGYKVDNRKRNGSYPDTYRRKEPSYACDLSEEPHKRPRSPDSEDERPSKYARYSLEQQDGHRSGQRIYVKDSHDGSMEKWNDVQSSNRSGNSVSSDGGNSAHSRGSPVERRQKHRQKESKATSSSQHRRSLSPCDLSDSDLDASPMRSKKIHRRHNSNKRNGHESRSLGSDQLHSARQTSPETKSYKHRHVESDSSPEVRTKSPDLTRQRKKNGRRTRPATNGRHSRHSRHREISPRRVEDLPQQYQPMNGGVNGYDLSPGHKNGRSPYDSPSDDDEADWSKMLKESTPEGKTTTHGRAHNLSPEHSKLGKTKQCNAASPALKQNGDKSKTYDSSPERISERNKRPRLKKR